MNNTDGLSMMILIMMLFLFLMVYSGISNNNFYRWRDDCSKLNGNITLIDRKMVYNRYECFVDGKMIIIPGYEGE